MKTCSHKALSATVVVAAAIAAIPFLMLCQYVFPVNDDYSFAYDHTGVGPFESAWASYFSWSGRFLATFLSSLNPLALIPDDSARAISLYPLYSLIVIFICLLAVWGAFRLAASSCSLKPGRTVALSALAVLVYISLCPSPAQAFYWFSSYTAYTLPSALAILFFGLMSRRGPIAATILALLALIIPGGNEITAVLFTSTLLYICYIRPGRRNYLTAAMACLGILIVILSPGNGVRMQAQLSAHPYLWSMAISVSQTFSWLFLWLPVILLSLPVYIIAGGAKIASAEFFNSKLSHFILFALIALFLAHIPVTFGLSSVMIDRTANSLLLFFIIYTFWGFNICLHKYPQLAAALKNRYLAGASLFCFLFLGPFSLNSPTATAFLDLASGKARAYALLMEQRIETVRSTPDDGRELRLPAMGLTSRALFVKEFPDDPADGMCKDFCSINDFNGSVTVNADSIFFESNFDAVKSIGKSKRSD